MGRRKRRARRGFHPGHRDPRCRRTHRAGGSLTVAALGTVTVALLPRSGWLLHGLYPGQHLSAAAAYYRELTASVRIGHYGLILLLFPVIGLLVGLWAGAASNQGLTPGNGGPPRPPGYTPTPDPPGGVQLAGTDADGIAASQSSGAASR